MPGSNNFSPFREPGVRDVATRKPTRQHHRDPGSDTVASIHADAGLVAKIIRFCALLHKPAPVQVPGAGSPRHDSTSTSQGCALRRQHRECGRQRGTRASVAGTYEC